MLPIPTDNDNNIMSLSLPQPAPNSTVTTPTIKWSLTISTNRERFKNTVYGTLEYKTLALNIMMPLYEAIN